MDLFCAMLLILVILIVLAQWYRLARVNVRPRAGDAFTYLRVAREIRKQGTWFPELTFYYSGEREVLNLPPLLMLILAPVSKWGYRTLIHTSTVIDLLTAAVVYSAAINVFGCDVQHALLAALIFLSTPVTAVTSASLTPRSLGLLWLTCFVVSMTMFVNGGHMKWLLAGAVFVCLALLSQRMVTQIIVISVPLLALALGLVMDSRYFTMVPVVIGGFVLAALVTKGRYLRVLRDHIRRVVLHVRIGQQDRFTREFGNPLHILKANPWVVAAFGFAGLQGGLPDPMWLAGALVIVVVMLSVLWVMGNAVNHMLFASTFVAWIVAATVPSDESGALAIALIGLLSWTFIMREYRMLRGRHLSDDWVKCFEYIKANGLEGRALVLPCISFPPLIYYTPLTMVSAGHGSKAIAFDRAILKRNSLDPAFLFDFIMRHGVRYLVIERDKYPIETLVRNRPSKVRLRECHRDGRVVILAVET